MTIFNLNLLLQALNDIETRNFPHTFFLPPPILRTEKTSKTGKREKDRFAQGPKSGLISSKQFNPPWACYYTRSVRRERARAVEEDLIKPEPIYLPDRERERESPFPKQKHRILRLASIVVYAMGEKNTMSARDTLSNPFPIAGALADPAVSPPPSTRSSIFVCDASL